MLEKSLGMLFGIFPLVMCAKMLAHIHDHIQQFYGTHEPRMCQNSEKNINVSSISILIFHHKLNNAPLLLINMVYNRKIEDLRS